MGLIFFFSRHQAVVSGTVDHDCDRDDGGCKEHLDPHIYECFRWYLCLIVQKINDFDVPVSRKEMRQLNDDTILPIILNASSFLAILLARKASAIATNM